MNRTFITPVPDRRTCFSPALAALLFACLLLSARAWAQQDWPEALRAQFQAGVEAEKAGRLDEAERDFLNVLRQGGNLASVHHNLGTIYQQRGEHLKAVAEFREAIRLQPQFLAPHILLGASLLATHQTPQAIRELDYAAKLAPQEPAAHLELARAYERAGNARGVVNQYQILSAIDPREAEYTYQLGQAYLTLSQWCIQQIRQRGPQSARWYESLAETLLGQGQAGRAIPFFQRAALADPKLPGIHLALAQIYLQQNRPAEAHREIALELRLVPESVAAKALEEQIAAREKPGAPP